MQITQNDHSDSLICVCKRFTLMNVEQQVGEEHSGIQQLLGSLINPKQQGKKWASVFLNRLLTWFTTLKEVSLPHWEQNRFLSGCGRPERFIRWRSEGLGCSCRILRQPHEEPSTEQRMKMRTDKAQTSAERVQIRIGVKRVFLGSNSFKVCWHLEPDWSRAWKWKGRRRMKGKGMFILSSRHLTFIN